METTLAATIRTDSGKGIARKLRAAGKLPAVMYGPGHDAVPVVVDPTELQNIFRLTGDKNTIVDLQVDGRGVPALVRDVQRHPVTRELLHVDFFCVAEGRKIEVLVPVEPVGEPVGAVLGGRIRLIRRVLRARCEYGAIPSSFIVNVDHLDVNDMIRVSEIVPPEGVELVYDVDYNVITLYGKAMALEEEEEEEGEGEEGEGEEGSEEEAAETPSDREWHRR
jgi:large subunit ribosomal protein L25